MTTIDIFVHPDIIHDQTRGNYNPPSYQTYFDDLIKKWESSECPILIEGIEGNKRFLETIVKKGKIFGSASYWLYDIPPFERGEICCNEWKKFVSLLNEINGQEFRIHGSYYGECTEGFAVQLYAHIYLKEHWHDYNGLDTEWESIERKERKKRKKLEKSGAYKDSNIRFGIVHSPRIPKKVIPPAKFLRLFRRYPHGNITYQMTDKKTILVIPDSINN